MSAADECTKLLKAMLEAIVDHPEEISIAVTKGQQVEVFEVSCTDTDIGKIIGKEGHNIAAIRKLMIACAAKHKIRATVTILDRRKD